MLHNIANNIGMTWFAEVIGNSDKFKLNLPLLPAWGGGKPHG